MSQQVTITSVTANTPVNISYCYANSGSCVYVATVSTFPFTFNVPDPYDTADFIVKIDDTQGCVYSQEIYITPTPTPSITASQTVTPTVTTTSTNTPSVTPTNTPTTTTTITVSPTQTPTPSVTPVLYYHAKGQNTYDTVNDCCGDILTSTNYYTYLSDGNTIPVVGIRVYTTQVSGTLYNPYNGNNRYLLMVWNGINYAVKIDTLGYIVDFVSCSANVTPTTTPTSTTTPTTTSTIGVTPTPTQSSTPTLTPTNTLTPTLTQTPTNTLTQTQTPTHTHTPTSTSGASTVYTYIYDGTVGGSNLNFTCSVYPVGVGSNCYSYDPTIQIGTTLYDTNFGGVLSNPFTNDSNSKLVVNGSSVYAIMTTGGVITSLQLCP